MDEVEGASTFTVDGDAYDAFMGRYSIGLSGAFASECGIEAGHTALDVGCGPGGLTGVLVGRLGAPSVSACDPSPSFVAACRARHPGVDVRTGRAEDLPFETAAFDHAVAQLVLHFVSRPERAAAEMARVVSAGGSVGGCVWDFDRGMEMLRAFWDAATALDPEAPDEARTLRFGRSGEIAELLDDAGLTEVREFTIETSSTYTDFDELWSGLLAGVGPAGAFCVSLDADRRARLRTILFERVGSPTGAFSLAALARGAVGRTVG